MSNRTDHNNDETNQGVSDNIKDTAGAAFHAVHKGLEATENAAMNAVDATADAVNNLTDNDRNNRDQRNEE